MGLFSNPRLLVSLGLFHDESVQDTPARVYHRARQVQVRLSADQVISLVELYHSGMSVPRVAEAFGINRKTVLEHLKRAGVPRRADVRKLTDDDVAQAADHYLAGESLATVGKRFGVDAKTIARELRAAGVEIRKRPAYQSPSSSRA